MRRELGAAENGGPTQNGSGPQPTRSQLVERPRLARMLLDERGASAVLVCAPPGYGKTALLRDWTERDARPSAWLTLSEQHEPATLIEDIVLALHRLEPVERGLLSKCRAAASERPPSAPTALLAALASTLSAMGEDREPAMLVLDDAHLPKGRGVQQVLSTILASTPSCAKVALASRVRAILPVGRLRAEGRLLELGQRDLALTRYEAARLLRASGLELDMDSTARLVTKTEGWPAVLYLAALALRGRTTDPDAKADTDVWLDPAGADAVAHAGADHAGVDRAIAEYVTQEILDLLPDEERDFLRRGAVLDRLAGRACDELLARSDSGAVLQRLASSEVVLVPDNPDGNSYRMHGLVREVLLSELKARDSRSAQRLSAKAGRWLEAHAEIERAIEHAVHSGDSERAGELLWGHASEFFMRGRDSMVEQWLSEFSEQDIAGSPSLTMCTALFSLVMLDLPGANHWAQVASLRDEGESQPANRALRGAIALVRAGIAQDGIPRMGTLASQARVMLGDASPWNSFCCLMRGVADHVSGERRKARVELESGARVSASLAPMVEALCHAQLAIIDVEEDALEHAADRCETAIGLVDSNLAGREPYATLVFVVSSWVAGKQGRCDEAKRDLVTAVALLSRLHGVMPWYEVETRLMLARAAVQLADVTLARASLSRASRVLRRMSDAPEFRTWLDNAWADIDERSASALSGPAALTLAELRILRFLPTHLTFREIGERLHVSTNTVKTQAHAVYGKLGATSRSEAVANACALGLIQAAVV